MELRKYEQTSFKIQLDCSRWYTIANIHFFYRTKAPAKFELAMSNGLGGDAFS